MIMWIDQNISHCQTCCSQHLAYIINREKSTASIIIKYKVLRSKMTGTSVPNLIIDRQGIVPCLQILITTAILKAETCDWTYVSQISIRGIPKYMVVQPLCFKSSIKLQYAIPYDRNDFYSFTILIYSTKRIIRVEFPSDKNGLDLT